MCGWKDERVELSINVRCDPKVLLSEGRAPANERVGRGEERGEVLALDLSCEVGSATGNSACDRVTRAYLESNGSLATVVLLILVDEAPSATRHGVGHASALGGRLKDLLRR